MNSLARFPVVHGVLHESHPTVRIASYAFREPFKRQSIETRQRGQHSMEGYVGPTWRCTRMEFVAKANADIHAIPIPRMAMATQRLGVEASLIDSKGGAT